MEKLELELRLTGHLMLISDLISLLKNSEYHISQKRALELIVHSLKAIEKQVNN